MITVTVRKPFKDGTLSTRFAELGYPAIWLPGRTRTIPRDLARACEQSGADLAVPDEDAPEDKIRPVPVPVAPPSEEERIEEARARLQGDLRVRVLFHAGFRDGGLMTELAAVGHPAEIKSGEIVELPQSLLQRIASSGGKFTTQADEIREAQGPQQWKHERRIQDWQKEQEAAREQAKAASANAEHNAKVREQIEELSQRYLKSSGKAQEALAVRIDKLYKELR